MRSAPRTPARTPAETQARTAAVTITALALAALAGCASTSSSLAISTPPAAQPRYSLSAGDGVGRMLHAPQFSDDLGDSRFAAGSTPSSIVITRVPTE